MGVRPRGKKYTADYYVNGRKTWIGTYETEDEATLAWIEAKNDPRGTQRETIADFCDRYISDFNRTTKDGAPRWGEKTMRDMASAFKPFRAAYGHMRLRDFEKLTADELRPWVSTQPTTYAQRVRTMLNDAEGAGLIVRNPLRTLRLEHGRGRKDITVLTEPDLERLFALARSTHPEFGPTLEAMLATAAYTCVRPGELFALRVQDVDVKAGTLDVMLAYNDVEMKRPKNGKARPGLYLPPQAAERIARMPRKLQERPCVCPDPRSCIVCEGTGKVRWLFETPQGGHFRKSKSHYYWNPVRTAFGRPGMDLYELRHAGATLLLERGVEAEDVAFQMGHTDGGKLVRSLYGEPHRAAAARRERIRRAFGENVEPLRRDEESEAANG